MFTLLTNENRGLIQVLYYKHLNIIKFLFFFSVFPFGKIRCWPASRIAHNDSCLLVSTPCVVPSHNCTAGLCDQQNMEEEMGYHFQDYIIKDSMAFIFGAFLPTHSSFILLSPPPAPCLFLSPSLSIESVILGETSYLQSLM